MLCPLQERSLLLSAHLLQLAALYDLMTEGRAMLLGVLSERVNKIKRLKVHQAARKWRRDSVSAQHTTRTGLAII